HLRRRLRGRLLQLQVGRGAERGCLRRVRGGARSSGRDRRALPPRDPRPRRQPPGAGGLPRLPRPGGGDRRPPAPTRQGGLGTRVRPGRPVPPPVRSGRSGRRPRRRGAPFLRIVDRRKRPMSTLPTRLLRAAAFAVFALLCVAVAGWAFAYLYLDIQPGNVF